MYRELPITYISFKSPKFLGFIFYVLLVSMSNIYILLELANIILVEFNENSAIFVSNVN